MFTCHFHTETGVTIAVASETTDGGAATHSNNEPLRKRFKASKEEEAILRSDQQANQAMARAYERSLQFNTSLKAVITWHEKHN